MQPASLEQKLFLHFWGRVDALERILHPIPPPNPPLTFFSFKTIFEHCVILFSASMQRFSEVYSNLDSNFDGMAHYHNVSSLISYTCIRNSG